MTVPSACDTRNSVVEVGTQRTAVHGEAEMHPALFRRLYRDDIGSTPGHMISLAIEWLGGGRTEPDEIAGVEADDDIEAI